MSERELIICVTVFVALYLAWITVIICAAAKSQPRKEPKLKFDERQIAAQGTAYKVAFWTMLVYAMLYAIISGAAGIVWCDPILGIFLGVIIGVTVFAVICILRDAYFRPDQSNAAAAVPLNVICFSQGIIGLMHLLEGTVIEDGVLSGDSVQLFLLLMGLIVDAALIAKHRMEKRETQE